MRHLLERLAVLLRAVSPIGRHTPLPTVATAGARGASAGKGVFDELSDDEIEARVQVATAQLHNLGAVEDTSVIPMRGLSDEQLDERIRHVERELRRLSEGAPSDDGEDRQISRAEQQAVIRQLEVLDYLIEHPEASISPTAYVDALEDEPRRWADELLADGDLRRD